MRHAPRSSGSRTSSAPRAAADVVQRIIGKNGHKKNVIHVKSRRVYLAKRARGGWYNLYGGEGDFEVKVSENDPDYDLYTEGDDEFSIRSSQKDRRVYTTLPAIKKPGDETSLHREGSGEQRDFSYTHVSEAFHHALKKRKLNKDKADEAVKLGSNIPLQDGPIPLDKDHDKDLQLIPLHLLHYQNFHTPPNLKSEKRKVENPWRQSELDQSKHILETLGTEGLKEILPEVTQDTKPHELGKIFPGFLDVSFPPDQQKSLFSYDVNKAVYLLNRKLRLRAFLNNKKAKKKNQRKFETEAFLHTIEHQEGSTIEDPKEYVKSAFGLEVDSGDESFDEAEEESPDKISKEIFNPKDNLEAAERRRRTFLNTLGTKVKWLNTKVLLDRVRIKELEESSKPNPKELKKAKAALAKHRRQLKLLQKRHDRVQKRHKEDYQKVQTLKKTLDTKKKLLDKLEPEGKKGSRDFNRRKRQYKQALKRELLYTPVKDQLKNRGFLQGIGEKTLKNLLSGKQPALKRKRNPSDSGFDDVSDWEEQFGGSAQYGDSDSNNCLIFAIAYACGISISRFDASQIRAALIRANLTGVDHHGFLPGYQRVVDLILQHLYAGRLAQGKPIRTVRIRIDTRLRGIQPVIVGDGPEVYILHDGVHFWWLKR